MLLLALYACDGNDVEDTSADPDDTDTPVPYECDPAPGRVCDYAGTGDAGFNGEGLDKTASFLYWPVDIEISPYGKPIIQDWNNHKIRLVEDDDTLTTIMGTDFVGDGPYDLSDQTAPGAPGTTVNLNHPTDAIYLPDGMLLSASWHTHKLRTWDPTTGLVMVHCGAGSGFVGDNGEPAAGMLMNQPKAVDMDEDGNIFIADMRNQRIRELTTDFTILTVAGNGTKGFAGDGGPATDANFAFPDGIQPEPGGGLAYDAGKIYVADTENNRIRVIDLAANTVETLAGTGEATYTGDGGPAVDATLFQPKDLEIADGVLYIADTYNNVIRTIDLATGIIDTIAGTGEKDYTGDKGPAIDAAFNAPFGVELDDDGNIYVADTFNHRIRVVYK